MLAATLAAELPFDFAQGRPVAPPALAVVRDERPVRIAALPEGDRDRLLQLGDEHREIEALAAELRRLLEAQAWLPAVGVFDRLEAALVQHQELEEGVLLRSMRATARSDEQRRYVQAQRQAAEAARRRLGERLFDDDMTALVALADELYALVCACQLLEECLLFTAVR